MRLAEASDVAPVTVDLDELGRALPVAHDLLREVAAEIATSAARKAAAPAGRDSRLGTPRAAAAPVAKASTVSEVEVSPSMVMALKLPATRRRQGMPAGPPAPIGASVKTKESIVAMSGAIMPAPLAMPLSDDLAAADADACASPPSETCRWS